MHDMEIDDETLKAIINDILVCEMDKLYQKKPRGITEEIEKIIKVHIKELGSES